MLTDENNINVISALIFVIKILCL